MWSLRTAVQEPTHCVLASGCGVAPKLIAMGNRYLEKSWMAVLGRELRSANVSYVEGGLQDLYAAHSR